jgi:hypothetical protein
MMQGRVRAGKRVERVPQVCSACGAARVDRRAISDGQDPTGEDSRPCPAGWTTQDDSCLGLRDDGTSGEDDGWGASGVDDKRVEVGGIHDDGLTAGGLAGRGAVAAG